MLTLLPDQGDPADLRPAHGVGCFRANATAGVKVRALVEVMVIFEELQA